MSIVLGHDQTVANWAGEKFGVVFHPPYAAWGTIDRVGTLNGAVIFSDFVPGGNVEMTLVGVGAMRRGVFKQIAQHVFNGLGCSRLTARTRRSNTVARRMLPKAGFKFEGIQRAYYGSERGDDALIFALFREGATRWMN